MENFGSTKMECFAIQSVLATLLVGLSVTWTGQISAYAADPPQRQQSYDHLIPEDSMFGNPGLADTWWGGEYADLVTRVLNDAYSPEVLARVIVIPSFENEHAIGIRRKNGRYYLFYIRPNIDIWLPVMMLHRADEAENIDEDAAETADTNEEDKECTYKYLSILETAKVETSEIPVEEDLATNLVHVFSEMLFETKFPRVDRVGIDGTTYHFSVGRDLAGKTWSPDENTKVGQLVEITRLMRLAVADKEGSHLASLKTAALALMQELPSPNGPG